MNFKESIEKAFDHINDGFRDDELAYLAVTSKIENPLRDRIAHSLHTWADTELLVHREWKDTPNDKRFDIAITDRQNAPQCLIELKAHSVPTYEAGYFVDINRDLEKLYLASQRATELYYVYFFNHIRSAARLSMDYKFSIKYWDKLNSALKKYEYSESMGQQTSKHWEKHVEEIGLARDKTKEYCIAAGKYYDMPVFIHAYLYGPFFKQELNPIVTEWRNDRRYKYEKQ